MKLNARWFLIVIFFFGLFQSNSGFAADTIRQVKKPYLTCAILKERVEDFLKYHYVFQDFNETLSERTFGMYFKILDPGKLYFLESDVNAFAAEKKELGNRIENVDCRFVSDVYKLYQKRVQEATVTANELLKEKINFKKEEYLETDRKKIAWAKSKEELKERWRKSIKFILLNMKESDAGKNQAERLKRRYASYEKNVQNRSSDEVNSLFLNAFALSLDPHSSFLTPVDNAQFQIDFSLKLVGIGATLISPDGYTTIDALVPGGAAAKSGKLKKGDKIIAVDAGDGTGMQDVIDMDLDKVVQLIRGKEGSIVKLMILRKDIGAEAMRFQIQLTRSVVQMKDYEAQSDVLTVGAKKIGVINLPSFYIDYKECQENPKTCRSSANDMARELKKLKAQNVDGIVIDLRRNGGGDLSEAQKIVTLFIPNPVVTQIQDKEQQVHTLDGDGKPVYTGPLEILISRYTASASEILAGAVQDYGRGLIVGDERTFGKGTVQTVIEIPGTSGRQTNGAIHVTIAKFFRPSGKSNQEKGILSDVIIPDALDATGFGESESEYALAYTTIAPASHFKPKPTFTADVLTKLAASSSARVKKSSEFKKILDDMKKVKQDQKSTLVSLKEGNTRFDPRKKDKKTLNQNEDGLPDFSVKVIRKDDAMLKESMNILADSLYLIKNTNWAKNERAEKQ